MMCHKVDTQVSLSPRKAGGKDQPVDVPSPPLDVDTQVVQPQKQKAETTKTKPPPDFVT